MRKNLLLASLLVGGVFTMNAQTVLFEDDFESYDNFAIENVGDWTLSDIDGANLYGFTGISFTNSGGPFAYIVFNPSMTTPASNETEGFAAHSGNKFMAAFASTAGANNDWL